MTFFVSSTFEDLKEYRHIAIEMLSDLMKGSTGRVEAMETFAATTDGCVDECYYKIKKSDVVIGIYGNRYGYIPKGDTLSITEKEFDYAHELGKPILAFVLNSENKDIQQQDFINNKINALGSIWGRFSNPMDFAQRLNESLKKYFSNLDGFCFDSLWNTIDEITASFNNETLQMEPYVFGQELTAINEIIDYSHRNLEILEFLFPIYNEILQSGTISWETVQLFRDNWELVHFGIPNFNKKINLAAHYLQLCYFQKQLLAEPWTEELRQKVLKARDAYNETAKTTFYSD